MLNANLGVVPKGFGGVPDEILSQMKEGPDLGMHFEFFFNGWNHDPRVILMAHLSMRRKSQDIWPHAIGNHFDHKLLFCGSGNPTPEIISTIIQGVPIRSWLPFHRAVPRVELLPGPLRQP